MDAPVIKGIWTSSGVHRVLVDERLRFLPLLSTTQWVRPDIQNLPDDS
jgi:hypothetical protein